MRSLTKTVFAAIAALAIGSAAHAADMSKAPHYAAPSYSAPVKWTGFYLGVNGGYGWGNTQTLSPETGIGPLNVSAANRGMLLGGQFGYRYQVNPMFVVGAFGDFDLSTMKGSGSSSANAFGFIPLGSTMSTSIDRLWSVRAEAGVVLWQDFLLSGNIGYGGVREHVYGSGTIFNFPLTTFDSTVSKNGLVYGAKLDYRINDKLFAEISATRYNVGSADIAMTNFAGTTYQPVNLNVNVIKAGLNYRF